MTSKWQKSDATNPLMLMPKFLNTDSCDWDNSESNTGQNAGRQAPKEVQLVIPFVIPSQTRKEQTMTVAAFGITVAMFDITTPKLGSCDIRLFRLHVDLDTIDSVQKVPRIHSTEL